MVKNVLIGIFVLLALGIIVFILLFLHPSVGDEGNTLRVRFTDVDKVNIGTRVTYGGLPVGEVVAIEEIPDARTDRISRMGDVYVYELTLKVDSGINVYNTDTISTRTSGLLGERNIAINPKALQSNEKLYPINNQIIYAEQTADVEDTLKQFGALSRKFEQVLNHLNDIFIEIKREKVVENLSETIQNVRHLSASLNQPEKWDRFLTNIESVSERANHSWPTVDAILQNFYSLTERAHQTWATINHGFHNFDTLTDRAHNSWTTLDHSLHNFDRLTERAHTSWTSLDQSFSNLNQLSLNAKQSWIEVDQGFHDFRTAAANTRKFTGDIEEIIHYTKQGKGTIGRLFVGEDLYLRVKSIFHKGETIMNDINQYGLLFHTNKQWQRVNARRTNLLNRLSTPQYFTQYFNDELDRISTSLSRVSMVLEETGDCYPQSLMCHPTFILKFSDLIKRVEGVGDALKIYNEQVVDQSNQECYPAYPIDCVQH